MESDFINQKTRNLAANTSYSFVEWCGVIDNKKHPKLVTDSRIYKNDLYLDFIDDYPDYAPKSREAISRNEFGKWLMYYADFFYGCDALQGRDNIGRWIEFIAKEPQASLDL